MALALHCDREDCDTWSYNEKDFLILSSFDNKDIKSYCCTWCLVVQESKYAEPTEVVQ